MATTQFAQMTKREKVKYLTQVLFFLSDSDSKKGVYSLPDIAKALYEKIVVGTSWSKIPLTEHYKRCTAYQYWYKKLKDSGKFQEVRNILRS